LDVEDDFFGDLDGEGWGAVDQGQEVSEEGLAVGGVLVWAVVGGR
jgi:hypothetical protein